MTKIALVHGAGGGAFEWVKWIDELERVEGFEVVSFDLIPSPEGLENTTITDYVDQIISFGYSCDVLVGASMGGVLCLLAAKEINPKALVIVCSAIPANVPRSTSPAEHPLIVQYQGGSWQETAVCLPDADEETIQFLWERWRNESGQVLNEITRGVQVDKPSCPVLSIVPGSDEFVEPSLQRSLASFLDAEVIIFPDMLHLSPLMGRQSHIVVNEVVAWLQRVEVA